MSANLLLNDVALYCLQIGLLVGLAGFVPAVFRLRLPAVKLAYWHVLLAACLLLPALRPWKQNVVDIGSAAPMPAVALAAPASHSPAPPRFPQSEILLALLTAGAVARLGWLSVGLWRLRRYRLHSTPATGLAENPELSSWLIPGLRPQAPDPGFLDLRLSEDVSSPVTFGFLRPVILLPAAFPHLDAPIQEAILAHELWHVRRRDWLVTLVEESVRAAFWFHPAIWWLLGETQLAREQVVDRASVELTRNREEYVDALLAIAGAKPPLDLAPAPLFLRKRHLKHRVVSLLKEVRMSKKHSISALAAGVCVLAAACWVVTATFPLAAAPQVVADGPGVSVDQGGAALLHRLPVTYPAAALAGRIEGTVVVQATVDSTGNVTDASVLSGPEELRKTAIQSVLQWHFVRGGGKTRTVTIAFQLPAKTPEEELPAPAATPGGGAATDSQVLSGPRIVVGGAIQPAQPQVTQPPAASPELAALMAQQQALMAQLRDATTNKDQQAIARLLKQMQDLTESRLAIEKIGAITVAGLSDQIRDELLASLPVRVLDAPTAENMARLREAVKQFDEHLSVSMMSKPSSDEVEVRIAAPGAEPAARITVGGQVQEANLTKKVTPVYPALARSTRIQGVVVLSVIIGKDGSVEEVKLVSGHPLLAPAAIEAVKQWTYKPTMLNGQLVDVSTQVTVNFALED